MADSQPRAPRGAGLLLFIIPVAAAAAHALLGWTRPELIPLVRSWQAAPAVVAAVCGAVILVLWLLLAAVPLASRLGWRQALAVAAPVLLPFVLLFVVLVPGIEARAGAGLVPLLTGIAWSLWVLGAAAMILWARTGRLPRADLAPPARRPEAWARLRAGADALLPFVLGATVVRVHLLDLHRGLGTLDQRALAYAAERVAEGSVLYRDVFAPLGPGPVYVMAGLFQIAQPSIYLAKAPEVVYAVLLALAAYAAGRRFATPLFAFLAALLVGCAVAPSMAMALVLFALVCAFRSVWSRELAWSLAGVLTGMAALFDPLLGALAAASLVVTIGLRQLRWVRARMTAPGVDMGLGSSAAVRYLLVAAVPVALAAAYFAWAKALPDLWRGAVAARYGTLGFGLPQAGQVRLEAPGWSAVMATATSARALLVPGVLLLGLLRLGYGLASRKWGEPEVVILGLVLLGALLLVLAPGAGAELAAVPALLVAAYVLAWAWHGGARVLSGESQRLAVVRLDGYALAALAVIVLVAGMVAPPFERIRALSAGATAPGEGYRPVRDMIRAARIVMDEPEATALERTREVILGRAQLLKPILCLPDCPELYFLADRDAPARFIVTGDFTTAADDVEIAAAITNAPPAVVVLRRGEAAQEGLNKTMARVRDRYRPRGRFGPYEVWLPR